MQQEFVLSCPLHYCMLVSRGKDKGMIDLLLYCTAQTQSDKQLRSFHLPSTKPSLNELSLLFRNNPDALCLSLGFFVPHELGLGKKSGKPASALSAT